ncbi:bifunctional 2-polyprenyl-6-hydroxyphenol methylase/3-demethylubiquinol 3-O-methyltransferase UbiG [Antrihabitans stalactiti]|uniref:3-demethylubiquinone-9 3-O-methyltransferase n=1 Tax=Antrihabitans stalactiti TaxID=2584121 RepID=A0A848KEU2_9NOCA|nr:bifunctional 2-polyprenyl-6-hydroxyphenol methylase/3-demethylubiquinol 3-O-methyltransferase UbiG [Antrihabitans stalactiti]NMN96158.1 3-demethylubiquinone-9 3-O-methyltransferase [Antrihabitans stalactiti]
MSEIRSDFITDYDALADEWWDPRGSLAPLGWIARARAAFVPTPVTDTATLVDVACGGGLFGPHLEGKGYKVIGVDLSQKSLEVALGHGYDGVVRSDISWLPFPDASIDVVTAGQCLEHVRDPYTVVEELCRVLRPGGTLVLDTIADTKIARLLSITVAENVPLPGRPPKGTHDHRLFVNRKRLIAVARAHGVELTLHGLRPSIRDGLPFLVRRREEVRMVPVGSTAVLFLGVGTKSAS